MSIPGLLLLLGPMSGFMALMPLRSLLISLVPDTSKGRKDKVVQCWSLPSLDATLGRIGPLGHQLKHSGERALLLTWAAQ